MRESESPLDAPEMWIRAGFNALTAHIAVLDAKGTIVAVNAAWERFGRAHQAPSFVWTGVGLNYLDVCWQAAKQCSAVKHSMDADAAQKLLDLIDRIDEMWKATGGLETTRANGRPS